MAILQSLLGLEVSTVANSQSSRSIKLLALRRNPSQDAYHMVGVAVKTESNQEFGVGLLFQAPLKLDCEAINIKVYINGNLARSSISKIYAYEGGGRFKTTLDEGAGRKFRFEEVQQGGNEITGFTRCVEVKIFRSTPWTPSIPADNSRMIVMGFERLDEHPAAVFRFKHFEEHGNHPLVTQAWALVEVKDEPLDLPADVTNFPDIEMESG